MSHSRWNLLPALSAEDLRGASAGSRIIAQLLKNRGIEGESDIEMFLAGDARLSADPNLLPGMHEAFSRIYRALLRGEVIAVYGDFDADGITATALLVRGLSMLGCNAIPYIPHRVNEGYGLKISALEKLREQGVNLVITVDCGITAVDEVRKAKKIGLDIIVTDHHTPPDELPAAVAVIDPKMPGSEYPFTELAGVGVAMKLLQVMFKGLGRDAQLDELLDLVALGTVADMVPLLGENRYLVKRGLEVLNGSPRLGVREIIDQAGLTDTFVDSERIAWTIAPRLNAAGRLEHAMGSYNLLMTDSKGEARELAGWLERKNAERQKLTTGILERARAQVLEQKDAPLLIAGDTDYPAGIIGLVAGRLTEEFYRPVIVLRTGERLSGGSCRSIPEFDIIRALGHCSGLLTHFGGHARAAGLGLRTAYLSRFREKILAIAEKELAGVDLRPRIDIDAEIALSELEGEMYWTLQRLAPFGQGNPVPVFISRGVEVLNWRTMGNDGSHLRFNLRQGRSRWEAVGFSLGGYSDEITTNLDIVCNLQLDTWNGRQNLRLNILDFSPSQS